MITEKVLDELTKLGGCALQYLPEPNQPVCPACTKPIERGQGRIAHAGKIHHLLCVRYVPRSKEQ